MATRPTRRWPASLHGGQVVILMTFASALACAVLSVSALWLWSSDPFGAFATGPRPWQVWMPFAGGVVLLALAHRFGRMWARSRHLSTMASLLLALWFPAVFGAWAYHSFSDVDQERMAKYEIRKKDDPSHASLEEQRLGKIGAEYALLLLADGVVAGVLLFFWFGGRTRKPEVTP